MLCKWLCVENCVISHKPSITAESLDPLGPWFTTFSNKTTFPLLCILMWSAFQELVLKLWGAAEMPVALVRDTRPWGFCLRRTPFAQKGSEQEEAKWSGEQKKEM